MKRQDTGQTHDKTATRTYRFEFGSDGILYSASFKATIPRLEVNRMLASARNSAYEKCNGAIRSYLDSNHLEYSDFISSMTQLQHDPVMVHAHSLLLSDVCWDMDRWIGNVDEYYAVMDHQRQMEGSYYEGCYLAVSRTSPRQQGGCYEYHIIGQTFHCNGSSGKEQSRFAILQGMDSHRLYTLDAENGCPILATFGCVDMLGLLINIDSITTKEQAASLANR